MEEEKNPKDSRIPSEKGHNVSRQAKHNTEARVA
jgi:hypothetical protein